MEPVKRLGVLLAIGAALLLAGDWLGMPAAQAQERCWEKHTKRGDGDSHGLRGRHPADARPGSDPRPGAGSSPSADAPAVPEHRGNHRLRSTL
jgi:hypothetical protein